MILIRASRQGDKKKRPPLPSDKELRHSLHEGHPAHHASQPRQEQDVSIRKWLRVRLTILPRDPCACRLTSAASSILVRRRPLRSTTARGGRLQLSTAAKTIVRELFLAPQLDQLYYLRLLDSFATPFSTTTHFFFSTKKRQTHVGADMMAPTPRLPEASVVSKPCRISAVPSRSCRTQARGHREWAPVLGFHLHEI